MEGQNNRKDENTADHHHKSHPWISTLCTKSAQATVSSLKCFLPSRASQRARLVFPHPDGPWIKTPGINQSVMQSVSQSANQHVKYRFSKSVSQFIFSTVSVYRPVIDCVSQSMYQSEITSASYPLLEVQCIVK